MSNEPGPEESDFEIRWRKRQEEHRRRELHADAMARYLSGALRFLGVSRVESEWDGYGDDGTLEPGVYTPTPVVPLPPGVEQEVQSIFDAKLPSGCEINAGSFGTLSIDAATGLVQVDLEYRDEDEIEWDEEEAE